MPGCRFVIVLFHAPVTHVATPLLSHNSLITFRALRPVFHVESGLAGAAPDGSEKK
jgi:hypothetical protein